MGTNFCNNMTLSRQAEIIESLHSEASSIKSSISSFADLKDFPTFNSAVPNQFKDGWR
jgi:hypothetical protein